MKEGEKMTRLSITVPESIAEQFRHYCEEQRRSVSAQVTLLMEKLIKETEESQRDASSGK